jgi:dTDP-4-amino-4,6-dideoxygalactose transaminase
MKVLFNNLNAQWNVIKEECLQGIESLFEKSNFILGKEVEDFENTFSDYIGTKYAVGVSNGTDALKLAARALNLKRYYMDGKELRATCFILPANTFIATLMGIEEAYPDAHFELIDCDEHYQIDAEKLQSFIRMEKEKFGNIIIVPVHLYGYTCNMDAVREIAYQHQCHILEDASQAHGALWRKSRAGSMGDVAAFSLYPGKNLGAAGDGGVITTNSPHVYERLKILRNLGAREKHVHTLRGSNHRLDTIQAIILNANESRRRVAKLYEEGIDNDSIILPQTPPNCTPVHHIYPIRTQNRERLIEFLKKHEIETGIHYPIPIEKTVMYSHLAMKEEGGMGEFTKMVARHSYMDTIQLDFPLTKKAESSNTVSFSEELLSLPIHPFMSKEEVTYVCDALNTYKE